MAALPVRQRAMGGTHLFLMAFLASFFSLCAAFFPIEPCVDGGEESLVSRRRLYPLRILPQDPEVARKTGGRAGRG